MKHMLMHNTVVYITQFFFSPLESRFNEYIVFDHTIEDPIVFSRINKIRALLLSTHFMIQKLNIFSGCMLSFHKLLFII